MGRWAQYRKRGSTRESIQPPQPPTPTDWSWDWNDDEDLANATAIIVTLPPGAIGWQLEQNVNAGPFTYADQTFDLEVLLGIAGTSADDVVGGRVRWIVSGAGHGDPDSVYSDWSATKTVVHP